MKGPCTMSNDITAVKPETVSLAVLREAIGRALLATYDDSNLGTLTECAKWTGTAIFEFMEAPYRDLTKTEAIVACRMLGHILLDAANNLEDAKVTA